MNKTRWLKYFWILINLVISMNAFSQSRCAEPLQKMQDALKCYIAQPELISNPWLLLSSVEDETRDITIDTYLLTSQQWPKTNNTLEEKWWQHNLVIYRPKNITTHYALLFVNGNTRYMNPHSDNPGPQVLDFARMAAATHSVVVNLQDVPNQYLSFSDQVLRKEDSIIAYTWNRFMDDPNHNYYWPLHLPMTKAVVKAMDATQAIIEQDRHFKIKKFVVSGASKRGLTTWLAALVDQRVQAIVPMVIDILNTQQNIAHIYASYDQWPVAFHDYVAEKIPERIHTAAFTELMKIEDPISYLNCKNCNRYKTRLTIPKYIISSSGDDFFVPDSLNMYLHQLPGETIVRMVPNQPHFIETKIIEDALLAYYKLIIRHTQRPELKWHLNQAGILTAITTSQLPRNVKLWQAKNKQARDFRFNSNIRYSSQELTRKCKVNECRYPVSLSPPSEGWQSSFVEVEFVDQQGEILTLTTPAYVMGK